MHLCLNTVSPYYSSMQRRGGEWGKSSPAPLHFFTFWLFLSLSSAKIQYGTHVHVHVEAKKNIEQRQKPLESPN